jgi:hypothetical protein
MIATAATSAARRPFAQAYRSDAGAIGARFRTTPGRPLAPRNFGLRASSKLSPYWHGVPGDEKFETELAAWLKQADEQLKDELSQDPTGAVRTR